MIYKISDRDGGPVFDARIELVEGSVLLHSRGGATGGRPPRNVDYSKALATVLRRLRAHDRAIAPIITRILLDSRPARAAAEEERVLVSAAEMTGLSDGEVIALVRRRAQDWGQKRGARGGNGTKALRIDTAHDRASLRSTLRLFRSDERNSAPPGGVERLPHSEQYRVTTNKVIDAVQRLHRGDEAPNFAASRDYDVLLPDGIRLAPKKVFGLALESALGIEALPGHFSAGWGEPCFQLIQAAGYSIVPKTAGNTSSAKDARSSWKSVPPSPDDLIFLEGDKRMVGHFRMERRRNSAAARLKREQILREHHRLVCEHCGKDFRQEFGDQVAEGCFEIHHTVPLSSLDEARETQISDLECLCATCHRAVHRAMALGKPRPQAFGRTISVSK